MSSVRDSSEFVNEEIENEPIQPKKKTKGKVSASSARSLLAISGILLLLSFLLIGVGISSPLGIFVFLCSFVLNLYIFASYVKAEETRIIGIVGAILSSVQFICCAMIFLAVAIACLVVFVPRPV